MYFTIFLIVFTFILLLENTLTSCNADIRNKSFNIIECKKKSFTILIIMFITILLEIKEIILEG